MVSFFPQHAVFHTDHIVRLWRVWGVDLIQDGYIGQNPRIIWISTITATCATALSIILKLVGFCFFYAKVASCLVSWVSMACLCATGATSQIFVGNIASGLPKLKVTGTGHISAQGHVSPLLHPSLLQL